ncbi:MAG: hypothetical protein OES18_23455 [Deltaproteobacteria bacterium]|nr:hypothetical protein [Deltaproteobacteria bacterium]
MDFDGKLLANPDNIAMLELSRLHFLPVHYYSVLAPMIEDKQFLSLYFYGCMVTGDSHVIEYNLTSRMAADRQLSSICESVLF